MTKSEITEFKKLLEIKQLELARLLRNRDDIAIDRNPDALDETQRAVERELAIRNLDWESGVLRNVRSALRRIEEGNYGVCADCEEEVSPRRLAAVPWTPLCIKCQEAVDCNQNGGASDNWLADAA